MDMRCEGRGADVTLQDLEYIHMHKTAALFEAALVNGACIGGASDDELAVMRRCEPCSYGGHMCDVKKRHYLRIFGCYSTVRPEPSSNQPKEGMDIFIAIGCS